MLLMFAKEKVIGSSKKHSFFGLKHGAVCKVEYSVEVISFDCILDSLISDNAKEHPNELTELRNLSSAQDNIMEVSHPRVFTIRKGASRGFEFIVSEFLKGVFESVRCHDVFPVYFTCRKSRRL